MLSEAGLFVINEHLLEGTFTIVEYRHAVILRNLQVNAIARHLYANSRHGSIVLRLCRSEVLGRARAAAV
jgi:hypothetical protein